MTPACSTCRFSSPTPGDGLECRRYPPQVASDVEGVDLEQGFPVHTTLLPFFPDVGADWWCGEFQDKRNPPP